MTRNAMFCVVTVVVIVPIMEPKGHLRTQMFKGFSTVLRTINRQGAHTLGGHFSYSNAYA